MNDATGKGNRLTNAALLTVLHFLVDAICVCNLMIASPSMSFSLCLLVFATYNITAFGTQPYVGFWIDRMKSPSAQLLLSNIFLIAGSVVSIIFSGCGVGAVAYLAALLLGAGNSLFHAYGGKYVTVSTSNDIRAIGVFVSTGALGLAIGSCFSSLGLLIALVIALVALSAWHLRVRAKTLFAYFQPYQLGEAAGANDSAADAGTLRGGKTIMVSLGSLMFVLFLILIVAGRSFIGTVVPSIGSGATVMVIMMAAVAMVGKAAGGFLAKIVGARNTLICSLVLACACLLLCKLQLALVPVTVFLINLSMPCTLFYANRAMPTMEGTAFGLLAAALLPGYYLGTYIAGSVVCQSLVTPLIATILIEGLLLIYMRERRWKVYAALIIMNLLTNVPLNYIALTSQPSLAMILAMEAAVVIVEALIYWVVTRSWRTAILYSVLCNVTSYLVGVLFQTVAGYFA